MTDRDPGTVFADPSLASAPTPVTPTPFGIPWSIWFWGGLLSLTGAAFALAPFQAAGLLQADLHPMAEPWARMFGLMMIAYSLAYHVAGWTGARTYMRASVVLRLASPLAIGGLVLNGNLPPVWMVLGLVDLTGAIWTAIELAWRPKARFA